MGGCDALFSAALARELHMQRVLVPQLVSVHSAFGRIRGPTAARPSREPWPKSSPSVPTSTRRPAGRCWSRWYRTGAAARSRPAPHA